MTLKDIKPGMVIATGPKETHIDLIDSDNTTYGGFTGLWAICLKCVKRPGDEGKRFFHTSECYRNAHEIPSDRAEELKREAGI